MRGNREEKEEEDELKCVSERKNYGEHGKGGRGGKGGEGQRGGVCALREKNRVGEARRRGISAEDKADNATGYTGETHMPERTQHAGPCCGESVRR